MGKKKAPAKKRKTPSAPKKRGQPTIYTEKLATKICTRLAHGESLRQICRDETMPCMSSVMDWLLQEEKAAFHTQYQKARELQAEMLFDETLEICDDGTNDWYDREVGRGNTVRTFDHEHAQRSKLRVETRKWYISKVLPKKYGEKLDITSKGQKITEPRRAVISYVVPKEPK